MDVTPPQNQNNNPQPPVTGPDPNPQPTPQPQQFGPAQPQPEQQWGQQPQPVYPQPQAAQPWQQQPATAAAEAGENPDKSFLITFLFSVLIGNLGIDRFYLGYVGLGIAKLLTGGGLGIWTLVDLLLVSTGRLTAKDDSRPLEGYEKNKGWAKIVAILLVVLTVLFVVGYIIFFILLIIGGSSSTMTTTAP